MEQDPPNRPSAIAPPLSYESPELGKRYHRLLMEPDTPIVFPDICCACLKPTTIRYTIRGNRIRASGAVLGGLLGGGIGAMIGDTLVENNHFGLKAPVCNRCWNAYQRRVNSWFWLGPLIGASAMLMPLSPILFDGSWHENLAMFAWAAITLCGFGAVLGLTLNRRLANVFAGPPAKIHLHQLSGRVAIRFRNPAYVEVFQRAQSEMPALEAAQLQPIDTLPASQPAMQSAVQWYYLEDAQPVGPVAFDVLCQRVADGTLRPEDSIWAEDQPEWVAATTVPGLFPADPAAENQT